MDPRIDTRDAEEHAAIAAALAELPPEHPACTAYFLEYEDTRALTHLVGRRDLSERLTRAFLDGYNRRFWSVGHFRP